METARSPLQKYGGGLHVISAAQRISDRRDASKTLNLEFDAAAVAGGGGVITNTPAAPAGSDD